MKTKELVEMLLKRKSRRKTLAFFPVGSFSRVVDEMFITPLSQKTSPTLKKSWLKNPALAFKILFGC